MSLERSKAFRLVSKNNRITNVTIREIFTLEKAQMLITLCPRLQSLTIRINVKDLRSIARFLWETNRQNTRHLHSVHFLAATNVWLNKLEVLIKSEKLLNDFTIRLIDSKLYLWY